ncbi:MAG: primosomal protein N', partial [Bacteroidetes bacterium]|nr:primosomal protein N' [Bacteroidota bacterium]
MPAKPTYTDVILPLPLPGLYTYHIPEELSGSVAPGKLVVVQFGKKKNYTAIVHTIHKNKPAEYETKAILSVLDDIPVINPLQVRFWEWIAGYYLCTLGEVYKAALPSGLKLESETKVIFNPGFRLHETLDGKEELLHRVLESRNVMTIRELNSLPGIKNCLPVIKSLHDKKAVFIEEQMIEKYKPVYITYVGLPENLGKEENLRPVFDELARAPKQLEILMTYINLSRFFSAGRRQRVTKKQLMDNCSAGHQAFTSLITKGILLTRDEQTGRLPDSEDTKGSRKNLNDFQEKALEDIRTSFTKKDVVLLHGVTSSGKTEIYIHLIQEYLDAGKQVLYLLPEIALTAQIINRLKHVFGKQAGVYHSKFSDSERVEIWNSVLNSAQGNGYNLILGVRSSVFLPFSNLGLVIVDEEHENTYKQYDPAPRYNARDAAIVLAQLHGAKTLLGSATPSIESYYNAEIQKYGFVEMNQRYLDIKMPDILIANTREAYKRKEMHSHFTPLLLEKIDNALCNKGQVILFQNRRGFAPYLECNTCGWIPQCPHCDVCLTYHKHINQLICHYCGHAVNTPVKCSACGMADLLTRGFGTEKIEDEIAVFFPKARIARMDLDTTRSKKSYERIIGDFENRSIDILVGTQMVTKGL